MSATRPALVFVVDRDPHVRRLMRHFLRDDYAVEVFETGYTALDKVRKVQPAILITEILVPELDGLALCRLLKADPSTQHVPILVLSMLASIGRAEAAGADGFIQKPLEEAQLLASIRGLTGGRRRGGALPSQEESRG